MHQIHLKEKSKTSHELQWRLNPTVKDVVRTEGVETIRCMYHLPDF